MDKTVRAIDVAAFITERKKGIDPWSLQKLTYYAQAWALVWDGHPLFSDNFEAWRDGPVVPELYRAYNANPELGAGNPDNVTGNAARIVEAVIAHYGELSSDELIQRTHGEDPWINARGGLPEGAYSDSEIAVSDMRRFYSIESVKGGDVPKVPVLDQTFLGPSGPEFMERLEAQKVKWARTLEWLAAR